MNDQPIITPAHAPTEQEAAARREQDDREFDIGEYRQPGTSGFEKELEVLINRYSMENESDTPDFILARFLRLQLDVFSRTVRRREHWYGRTGRFGS